MHLHPVARVYAEALLGVARAQQRADAIGVELAGVAALVAAQPDVRHFLETPTLEARVQRQALERALVGHVQDVVVDFLCLLIDKGRIATLGEIADAYRTLADAAAGRRRVHASSATQLSQEAESRLLAHLRTRLQSECILETAVKPELLGGLVLTIGDTVFDGSVRAQLRRVHNAIMRSSGYEN